MKSLTRSHSPLALFSLAMAALMCVLPFLVPIHRSPLTTFYGEWLAAALGLAASLLLMRPKSWQPFQFPVVALVPLGLIVVLGLQVWAGLAVYWQQHFLVGLYLLWAALLVVLGTELRREFGLEKLVPVLAWAILTGGLLCSLIVILQAAGIGNDYIVARKAAGYGANLMQINHLANYLGLALGSLLYLAATERLNNSLAALLATLLLFPLALTGQRMGWIYVVLLSLGAWLAGRKSSTKAWRALWLIPGFILMQLLIPLLPIEGSPMMATQKVVEGFRGPSIRIQLIQEAWQVFQAHPWLGAGWRQFGWQDFLMAESFPDMKGWWHHSHNLVLHLMAETGIAGALVLIAGTGFWLFTFTRQRFASEHWWLIGLLGVLGVHSLLEYPLWYGYFLGIAALLFGIGSEKLLQRKLDLGPLIAAGMIAFGALGLFNLQSHYPRLELWINSANKLDIGTVLDQVPRMRKHSLLAPYLDFVVLRLLPDTDKFAADKLTISTAVTRFMPGEREVYGQATLLAMAGRMQEARRQLKLAMIRYPGYANRYAVQLLMKPDPRTLPLLMQALRDDPSIR